MAASRAFYIVQGYMHICERGRALALDRLVFSDSDDGLQQFERYLCHAPEQQTLVLVDVIEEVFQSDTVPKLKGSDRKALLQRRIQRKYSRTPYRLPIYSAGRASAKGDSNVVYSAISNHELLDPWIAIILRQRTPLTGIHSVPLMAPDIKAKLFRSPGPSLLLTQHQNDKLRQSFVQDKLVKSARLSQSPPLGSDEYPQFIVTEIQRSRRYLERARLLSSIEQLDVCMIVDGDIAQKIIQYGESNSPVRMHFIQPEIAARRLRVAPAAADRLEALFIESALRRRPKHNYAVSGERRYWHMRQLRRAILSVASATAAVCSVIAGIYFEDAWRLYRESANIEAQVSQLEEAYRRENETFVPIKAGSYEMKLAVDTGDYILRQRLPAPWVMQQLGTVLSDHPNVRVVALSWQVETDVPDDVSAAGRGEPVTPVRIPPIKSIAVELAANIEPFDGDMRAAFEQIDRLVAELSSRTAFTNTWASKYPVDADPRAAIAGEIGRGEVAGQAQFQLQLRLSPAPERVVQLGSRDDRV